MLSLSTHDIRDLFFPAGTQPTPLHIDLALPDAVAGAAKVYFARSLGAKFKAPPPAGAEGDAVWHIDEQRLTVLVGRLDQHLAKMTYSVVEGVLDDLQEQVGGQAGGAAKEGAVTILTSPFERGLFPGPATTSRRQRSMLRPWRAWGRRRPSGSGFGVEAVRTV